MTVTTTQASYDIKCDDPRRVTSSAITTAGRMIMAMIRMMDIASSLLLFFFPPKYGWLQNICIIEFA